MQSIPEPAATSNSAAAKTVRPVSDLVYQAMTIAAILWLLASLWAF